MSAVLIADKLRASLLQAAIQGKLTKQLPEDGDAQDLLKEIEAERTRLIEEKIIRKEKPLPVITDEEIPFEIPENWAWVRLGDVGRWGAGATPSRSNINYYKSGSYNWLKTGDLTDGYINKIPEKITELALKETSVKLLPIGSVLIAMYGATIGKLGILSVEATTNQACCGCITYEGVLNKYLFYFLLFNRKNFISMGAGGAQPNISREKIVNTTIPLPPFMEQHRIVKSIETALEKIDKLKTDEDKLDKIQKALPNKLRSALLQSAIQGKLTEQLPADGDACDLLKEIEAEKTRMIEEKIIRKEKPLPAITDEEIPFEIPENWAWVRLGDVAIFINGDRSSNYPTEKDYTYSGIPFFGAKDMRNNLLVDGPNLRFIGLDKFKSLRSGKLQDLDFVCLLRGSIGKFALFYANKEYDTGFINAQMVIIRTVNKEMVPYFENIFKSAYFEKYIRDVSSGTAVKQLAAETLRNFLLPLPPIQEQRLVVEGLNEVMGKINHLIEIEG